MTPSPLSLRTPALALLLSLAILAACGRGDAGDAKGKRPIPVQAAQATVADVPVLVSAVGNVEAFASVAVKPQVGGTIAKQLVRDGQDVQKGTPLFVIDQRTYQAALQEAQAKLQKDQAQAAKAEDDLRRFEALFQQGAVSREQLDQMRTNAVALRASLALDRAQVEQARLQLGYATITSPIAGRAGNVLLHEGNLVKANDDRVLVVINQVAPIFVSFAVPEQHLPEIQQQAARGLLKVEARTGEGELLDTGELASIDNSVDKATGTIRLKAVFQNTGKNLWPGQFVRAHLRLAERKGAVLIPAQAVQTGVSGPFAFVVKDDMTVEMRAVATTPGPDQMLVADKGIAAGERVVTDGQLMLVPGTLVEIKAVGQPGEKPGAQGNATASQPGPKPAEGNATAGQPGDKPSGQPGEKPDAKTNG